MDSNKKLRGFMTKRGTKNDSVLTDVCLDSTQKLGDPVRRPLPYPRAAGEPVPAMRHRPSPRPRNATV
jgi:hypothetical protein